MKIDLQEITVLYCEDEDLLREITTSFLSKVVKKVYSAKNGKEGLELFRKHKHQIDMVISDIEMPETNGLEMAKSIKELIPMIPVIIVTAYSSSHYLKDALDLHVDKYILKPLDLHDLITVMEQSLAYHKLRKLYRDPLTGLHTCNALAKDLASCPEKSTFALLKIDDPEKLLDLYGSEMNKKIIIHASKKILEYFSDNYECYRSEANLFALLSKKSKQSIAQLTLSLKNYIKELRHSGLDIEGVTVRLNTVATVSDSISERIFELGRSALVETLRNHRQLSTFEGNPPDKDLRTTRNIQWVQILNRALETKRFQPYFQAIIDMQTGKTSKYEALIRYLDPVVLGGVTPEHFLDIAKKSNIYPIITRTMLREVIRIIADRNIRVAVNIAYADLTDHETLEYIRDLLSSHPDEARLLEFEILESEKIDNYDIAREFIDTVRPYGCKIGIDDFGKGYSNLSLLESLHVDYVKIDGSLIHGIDHSERQAIVVEGIHSFCKRLGIDTVAEKITNEAEYHLLRELGIEYGQGWYFSKAVPEQELTYAE